MILTVNGIGRKLTRLSDFAGFRLQANLSKCVDLGRFAFMETEKQIGKINMLSGAFNGTVSVKRNLDSSP